MIANNPPKSYKKDLGIGELIIPPFFNFNANTSANLQNIDTQRSTKAYTPRNMIQSRKSQPNLLEKTLKTTPNEVASATFRPSTQGNQNRKLPKKLAMQLNSISKLFVTEINGVDQDAEQNVQDNIKESENDSYQLRFLNQTGSKFGSRTVSTASLISRKKSTQAIDSFKSASRKLKQFFKEQDISQIQSTKPLQKSLDNMKKINIQSLKNTFSHGFSQIKELKGYLSEDNKYPLTERKANTTNYNNNNITKYLTTKATEQASPPISQRNTTEGFIGNIEQENRIIQQINMSKFCSQITPGLEEELLFGKEKYNELITNITERTKKLHELQSEQFNLERDEINQSESLKVIINNLQKEIDEVNELINNEERRKESLNYMKLVREKDNFINSKPILLHIEIVQHMGRYLNKTSESLYDDSKKITKIFMEMMDAQYKKKVQESIQSSQWKSSQIMIQKEEEAEKLAEFESTMRQIVKNNQKEQKRQKAEESRKKKLQEELQKNALAFSLQEQIGQFNDNFIGFHENYPVVSSYKDLLDFCIHVKQNTEKLKIEEQEYKKVNNQIKEDVSQLQQQLLELKYSQETKTDQMIIQHNLERHPNEFNREDDYLDIPEVEKEYMEERRKQDFVTDKVTHQYNNIFNNNPKFYIKSQRKKQRRIIIRKCYYQDYTQRYFKKLKRCHQQQIHQLNFKQQINQQNQYQIQKSLKHQQKMVIRQFNLRNLDESIINLIDCIRSLSNLIDDIRSGNINQGWLNKQPSLMIDQMQDSQNTKTFQNSTQTIQQKEQKSERMLLNRSNTKRITTTPKNNILRKQNTINQIF